MGLVSVMHMGWGPPTPPNIYDEPIITETPPYPTYTLSIPNSTTIGDASVWECMWVGGVHTPFLAPYTTQYPFEVLGSNGGGVWSIYGLWGPPYPLHGTYRYHIDHTYHIRSTPLHRPLLIGVAPL